MSSADSVMKVVHDVEALMLAHFRGVPFHNLRLMYGPEVAQKVSGGTCSDKTLAFIDDAIRAGFDVSLHSGFIGGREIHRLARVRIGTETFFADVGNGWPALRLYPAGNPITFRCFRMGFRTEISAGRIAVFHEKRGEEALQLEIDLLCRSEAEIRADIDRRFSSGIVYPFSNSLRFSQIVGDRFLFLRGDRLDIYSESGFDCVEGITKAQVPLILLEHFGCDLRPVLHGKSPAPAGDGE